MTSEPRRTPADAPHWHGTGDVVSRPWLYELTSDVAFLGRRRRTYDDVLSAARLRSGDRVLDVGTGPGLLARRAARRVGPSGHVTGIDPSPDAVEAASRHRGENLAFEVAAAQRLPFAPQTFDVVVSMLALHHVGGDELGRALREMYRVLVPGGRLVVADFLDGDDEGRRAHAGRGRPRHQPVAGLSAALAEAGFEVEGHGSHAHGIGHVAARRPAEPEPRGAAAVPRP